MKNNVSELNLKQHLAHGMIAKIHQKSKVSRVTIYKVINGKCDNDAVLAAIADVLYEAKEKKEAALTKIQNAIS